MRQVVDQRRHQPLERRRRRRSEQRADALGDPWARPVARRLAQGGGRRGALWFTAFGMTDLVNALTLGALTGFALINVTPSGAPISELPLALIPTAAVPLLFALHITSVSALRRAHRAPLPAAAPLTAAAR